MNEKEIELIREYTQIHYLIKEAIVEIDRLKSSRINLKDMIATGTKLIGQRMRKKLGEVQKELRILGVHIWIEDDGGEIIFVCTSKNMVKGRNGIKRSVLLEDMEERLDILMKEFLVMPDTPYQVPDFRGDRYGSTYTQK